MHLILVLERGGFANTPNTPNIYCQREEELKEP